MTAVTGPGYVEVAVGLPLPTTFHYRIPRRLISKTEVGKRIWVPFRHRQLLGVVVGLVEKPQVPRVRSIRQVIDDQPVLEPELLQLTRWIAREYQCSWGQTIQTALPAPLRRGRTTMESRIEETAEEILPTIPFLLTEEQEKAVSAIRPAIVPRKDQV
jgi:primosomal protein N' (replication factor Y)